MPGPPPKPTALKILTGNPGKRKLNDREPMPEPRCAPPAWLAPEALVEWKRQAPPLERLGLLTEIDGEAFATLCMLTVALKDEDLSVTQLLYVSKELRGLWSRFGKTPADRSRVKVDQPKPDTKLQRFLGGKKA